jgi:hypothetical protein
MNIRLCLLCGYRVLLWFYPPAFRKRFAPEMLELAEAAEPGEWPLIFGDTGVAIVRCWLQGTGSTPVLAEPGAYLALGGSAVRGLGLLQGFALSVAIIGGVCYAVYRTPCCPQCTVTSSVSAQR